jgi:hypothetical protein
MLYRKVVKKALPYFEEAYIEKIVVPPVEPASPQDPEDSPPQAMEWGGITWSFTEILHLFSHLALVAPTSLVDVLPSRLL